MNATAIAHIDISRPSGRKIVREIEKRAVKMEFPMPAEMTERKWHTVDEVFAMVEKRINDRYGTNYKI